MYDPDSKFGQNILTKLEEVMGIQLVLLLAAIPSQLTASSGVKLVARRNSKGFEVSLPNKRLDPVNYVKEVMELWSEGHSHRLPTWRELLNVMNEIGLKDFSEQIETFLTGETI